jgi:hypothetical protein
MNYPPPVIPLLYAPDGSQTVYLQAEEPVGVLPGNWLPTPAVAFSVALRTYLPQLAILDGIWFPPGLERTIENNVYE